MPCNAPKSPVEARQLIADFYGCDPILLDDAVAIQQIIHTACTELHTSIVEECCHRFEPIGVSAFAIITTSHFSIHTWPEFGYAAVDIFSCQEEIPGELCDLLAKLFRAEQVQTRLIHRSLNGGEAPR